MTTEHTDTLTRRHNNGISNDPCVLCGERCDPDGRDYFLNDSWALVCDVCVKSHVGPIVDLIEQEHTEMRADGDTSCQYCGPLPTVRG